MIAFIALFETIYNDAHIYLSFHHLLKFTITNDFFQKIYSDNDSNSHILKYKNLSILFF